MTDSKQDAAFEAWRRSDDYPRWNDFKVFHAESGETLGVVNTRDAEERERAAFAAGRKAREGEVLAIVTDGLCDHERDMECTDGAGFCVICAQNSIVTEIERRIKETA